MLLYLSRLAIGSTLTVTSTCHPPSNPSQLNKLHVKKTKHTMKKLLVAIVGFACAYTLTVNAAETPDKPKLTDEQKAVRKEMVAKYDANKDGKLDKEERAKMSKAAKDKWESAGLSHK